MGLDATDYVYKITVDGTDIREYYDLPDRLPAKQVAELWLADAEANHGEYLPRLLAGRVNVELLTDVEQERRDDELDNSAIPLPAPEDDDTQ